MNEELSKKYEEQYQKTNKVLSLYLAERTKLNALQVEIEQEILNDQIKMQRRSRKIESKTNEGLENGRADNTIN